MIRSSLILMVIVATLGDGPPKKPEAAPLPALNAKVAEFAKANLGKSVGNGQCTTLAVEALREAGAARGSFRDPNADYTWGKPIPDLKDALPGDILQFRDAVFQGKRSIGGQTIRWHQEYHHHTAIVAKVERDGKLITVYHQNVTTKAKDETKNVQEGELRMESLQKGGWVKAYRPLSPDRKRDPIEDDEDK